VNLKLCAVLFHFLKLFSFRARKFVMTGGHCQDRRERDGRECFIWYLVCRLVYAVRRCATTSGHCQGRRERDGRECYIWYLVCRFVLSLSGTGTGIPVFVVVENSSTHFGCGGSTPGLWYRDKFMLAY
jgi:hypothetical protein